MDTSQICPITPNNTTVTSPNSLNFYHSTLYSNEDKYWQQIAPNPAHPFYILGNYLRVGAESLWEGIYSIKDYFSSFSLLNYLTVEDILATYSPELMKEYCDFNENHKKQAQEKLHTLITNHFPDNEQDLHYIQVLLHAGIRTNKTLYSTTILTRNIKLAALFNAYGIQIDRKDYFEIIKVLPYCTQEDEIIYKCNDIHDYVKNISQITTDSDEHEKIKTQMEQNYKELSFKLEKVIFLSKQSGKPLLILIGEDHSSMSGSFTNELILLDLISQKKLVKTIQTEDPLNTFKLTYFGSHVWGFQSTIEEKIIQLGMKKKFIDLFRFNETEMKEYKEACDNFNLNACLKLKSKFISEVGSMHKRNQLMAHSILESPHSDAVAIVGAHHIKGLIEDTELSQHFYIAAFNTSPFSDWTFPDKESDYDDLDKAEVFLLESKYVINIPELTSMSEHSGVFISPDILMQKTKAIHHAFDLKKMSSKNQSHSEERELRQCPKVSFTKNISP